MSKSQDEGTLGSVAMDLEGITGELGQRHSFLFIYVLFLFFAR